MYKEIILMAISAKHFNLCVAGIDTTTGEWIRIISEDSSIGYAVRKKDTQYKNGEYPKIFDIVRIKCKEYKPNYYQCENYVFDEKFYWRKVGVSNINKVLDIYKPNFQRFIFYNADNRVCNDYIRQLGKENIYSLILIKANNVSVRVKQFPERKKVTIDFDYKNVRYNYLSLTDLSYREDFLSKPEGIYNLGNNVFLVLSLGECYKDGNHYKLVTTIIK